MARAYGTRLDRILGDAVSFDDLGQRFGEELTAAEVRYLMRHEFAQTAEDILWRRTKLGLRVGPEAVAALSRFMERNAAAAIAAE
jgi:glycerol-3-phosphate dehydrogenase